MSKKTVGEKLTASEMIYDKYSAMLYGLLLKVSEDDVVAGKMLKKSFRSFFLRHDIPHGSEEVFPALLQITIRTVSDELDIPVHRAAKLMFEQTVSDPRFVGYDEPYIENDNLFSAYNFQRFIFRTILRTNI